MKYSQFNSLIKVSDNCQILYNSKTNRFAILPLDFLPENPFDLDNRTRNCYLKNGFLVPINHNEIEYIYRAYKNTTDNPREFILTINPTLECNFRCWYCYESHSSAMIMSDEILLRLKCLVSNLLDQYQRLTISFFGGEPLLEYERIVKPLMIWSHQEAIKKDKVVDFTFTTNGFLLTEKMADFFSSFNCNSFQITLDGNREHHNQTRKSSEADSFLTIIEHIHILSNKGQKVFLRLNLTHKNIEGALEIPSYFEHFSDFEKQQITLLCEQVWQDACNGSIADKIFDIREEFQKVGIKSSRKNPDSIHFNCYADKKHSALVNYNGDVYKCTAINFPTHPRDGVLTKEGEIVLKDDLYSLMLDKRSRKLNSKCGTCRILPLCNGGCYRKLMLDKGNKCLYPTDIDKDNFILENIEEIIHSQTL